jgi:4-hydroxythreonine-4-phosphate dehydrogenase
MALGDAGGIGAELAARVLADADANRGDLTVIGDARLLERGAREAGVTLELPVLEPEALCGPLQGSVLIDLANCDPAEAPLGSATAYSGRAALENFRAALLVAQAGLAGTVFFTPFNKHAMRLAKPDHVDEIGFINATLRAERSGREFNVLDEVWNARVTSHIPLREVAEALSAERI